MGEEEKKKPQEEEQVKKPVAEVEVKKTEEKKTEEKKPEENKPEEEKKTEESNNDSPPPPPPPPPEEVVLRVYMHCEGCARKVKRCLRGFPGVEDVQTDCKFHKVIVKGKMAAADPLKVCERIQKKSHRKVELISPIPRPPEVDAKKTEEATEEIAMPEEKKEEPKVITVLLKVHMHCEACALEIQRRIMRMKGVQAAEPDPKSSQVTVKGVFDSTKLVEWVYKRTGKHATIVKTEPEEKKEEEDGKGKEEKKGEEKEKTEGDGEKKEGEEGKTGEEEDSSNPKVELVRNEFYYYPTKYAMEYAYYPPQIFSDENPNACSIM